MSTPANALRVAIVGSGPAGFYAAEALQKSAPGVRIDMYEQLPTPFGLVRGGVAPDHPKIKSVTRVFERIARAAGFRFFGHVNVGRDVTHDELRSCYDALIYAVGAETDRPLGIPGEDLPGSHAATELVGWYNGHPEFVARQFDLSQSAAAIVGIGNVALDAARILARPADELAATDLAAHALQHLRRARLETLHIVARRGPVQAACTTPELRELGELPGVDVLVDPRDLELDPISARYVAESNDRTITNNLALWRQWADRGSTGQPRRIVFHFGMSPVRILGDDRVTGVRLVRNALIADGHGNVRAEPGSETVDLPVGLVFRSVGYRGVALPGLPFDDARGIIPNMSGRVVEGPGSATPIRGLYVTGWIKRGPHGVIGTNKTCATETIDHLLADAVAGRLPVPTHSPDELQKRLEQRGTLVLGWEDWCTIDQAELARGTATGRAREKFVSVDEMLDAAHQSRQRRDP